MRRPSGRGCNRSAVSVTFTRGMTGPSPTELQRAEALAERVLQRDLPRRRMLVIVNPYATTVSDRLKNLVVYALQSRYEVEAVDTEAASPPSRSAAGRAKA